MRKFLGIFVVIFLYLGYQPAQGETPFDKKNDGFAVKLWDNMIVFVPRGTIEQQCQFIAYRATQQPYTEQEFDFTFFDSAFVALQKFKLQTKGDSVAIKKLKEWRSYILPEGKIIEKTEFDRFLYQTKNRYSIKVTCIKSSDQEDLIQVGSVEFRIVKKQISSKRKKNKITIPQGSVYLITKQPLT